MMIVMPATATPAPMRSPAVSWAPSTNHNQAIANGDVDTAGPLLSTARSPAPAARDQRRQLIQSSATQQLIVVTNRRFCARRSEPRLLR